MSQIRLSDLNDSGEEGYHTLGKLKCYGQAWQFLFFVLFFAERAQITGVGMENDPLKYVELVSDLRTTLKLTAIFQTAVSE